MFPMTQTSSPTTGGCLSPSSTTHGHGEGVIRGPMPSKFGALVMGNTVER